MAPQPPHRLSMGQTSRDRSATSRRQIIPLSATRGVDNDDGDAEDDDSDDAGDMGHAYASPATLPPMYASSSAPPPHIHKFKLATLGPTLGYASSYGGSADSTPPPPELLHASGKRRRTPILRATAEPPVQQREFITYFPGEAGGPMQFEVLDGNSAVPVSMSGRGSGKRVFQACRACQTRKAKCDGERPACTRCKNRALECIYNPARRLRGPNRHKDSSPTPTSNQPDSPSPQQSLRSLSPSPRASSSFGNGPTEKVAGTYGDASERQQPDLLASRPIDPPQTNNTGRIYTPVVETSLPRIPPSPVKLAQPASPFPAHLAICAANYMTSPSSFHSPTAFSLLVASYLKDIPPPFREQTLVTRDTYDQIMEELLKSEPDTDAEFALWVRENFGLATVGDASGGMVVWSLETKKRVAYREELYDILIYLHAVSGHGGKEKVRSLVAEYYSWIPVRFIELFVNDCPTCRMHLPLSPSSSSSAIGFVPHHRSSTSVPSVLFRPSTGVSRTSQLGPRPFFDRPSANPDYDQDTRSMDTTQTRQQLPAKRLGGGLDTIENKRARSQ